MVFNDIRGIRSKCGRKRHQDMRVYDEKYYRKLGEKSVKRIRSKLQNELDKLD